MCKVCVELKTTFGGNESLLNVLNFEQRLKKKDKQTKAFYDWATTGIPVTRPCEQGNWDTWMVLDPWNQV